jgi:phosphoribosylglycinamide formyltransferase-1
MARRVGVLISGSGSNLQALLEHCAQGTSAARIVLVVSNRPDAYGLERARAAGIAAEIVDHRRFADRRAFEAALEAVLEAAAVELVCLAGFMRVLTAELVARWHDRMLNIHPSLLPAFRGLDTHRRVLAAGLPVSGCTVHLVRPELDNGPALVQGLVPVLPGDDPARLGARVLEVEHRCYPLALELLARDRVRSSGDRVLVADERPGERLVVHPLLQALS